MSCPDIALLLPLAGLLEVSTEELLNGQKTEDSSQTLLPETCDSMEYTKVECDPKKSPAKPAKTLLSKAARIKTHLFFGVSAVFLLAAAVCLICDYFTAQAFTWSLPVLASLGFAWILLFPFGTARRRPLVLSLSLLTIFLIPYLAILSRLLKSPLLLSLGACISVISLAALWCFYGVCSRYSGRKYRAFGIFFLLAALLSFGISLAVSHFLGGRESAGLALKLILTLSLAALCFLLDYCQKQSR